MNRSPIGNRSSFDMMVTVHEEDGSWWADSGCWSGWSAAGDSREALMNNIRESVEIWRPGTSWYAVGPLVSA